MNVLYDNRIGGRYLGSHPSTFQTESLKKKGNKPEKWRQPVEMVVQHLFRSEIANILRTYSWVHERQFKYV